MKINPLISVVIPVYNYPEALESTLQSVIAQSYSNLEVLVVDDGSDMEINPMIEKLNDHRISYYKLEHKNANIARNYGISISKGEYIAILDADDIWLENHIESCLDTLIESQTDDLYGSLTVRDTTSLYEVPIIARSLNAGETMIDYLLDSGWGTQTSTLFMTAESAKNISWNPDLKRHQDYDFVIRYSRQYKFAIKTKPTVIYILAKPIELKMHFKSCIRFIRENENEISPYLYNKYNFYILSVAKNQNASFEKQDWIDVFQARDM